MASGVGTGEPMIGGVGIGKGDVWGKKVGSGLPGRPPGATTGESDGTGATVGG